MSKLAINGGEKTTHTQWPNRPIRDDKVEPDTWGLDIEAVERKISPRTKAIMPVRLGGRIVDMGRPDIVRAIKKVVAHPKEMRS